VSQRVLVVDDEPAIADSVSYALRSEGFEVDIAGDGERALQALDEREYDVMILDLLLPRVSGIEVCRRLRERHTLPVLMLSARDAEVDRVLGLEVGADDYVTKPFSMAELVSRVRAILRRRLLDRARVADPVLRVGGLELDLLAHSARVDGLPVHLTASELKLLGLLAREPDAVFTRRAIMQHLWESEHVGDQRACDTHVANLRAKIERDPGRPQRLVTVRGSGYKLVAV
jgi:two-component system, OmpR family, response regulator RegX3